MQRCYPRFTDALRSPRMRGRDANLGDLTYDNQGQLASWQNAQSNPTSTASSIYDGEGNHVQQVATTNGTPTTTTSYIGSLEEVSTFSSTTTTTA